MRIRLARTLPFAATPTFALMALAICLGDDGRPDSLCAVLQHASPFGNMATMYALMSAFHLSPWLRLATTPRRRGADEVTGPNCPAGRAP